MRPRTTFPCIALALALTCAPTYAQDDAAAKAETATEKNEKDPNAKPEIPDGAAVDATVWGAVVYASSAEKKAGTKAPAALPDIDSRLGKIKSFKDFRSFEVIGQHTQKVFSAYTNWLVPSKELFLNIDSKGPEAEGDGINLHVQLWRRTKVLVKTDTTLKKGSPLIIAGPAWRDGQLIFVLMLK